MKELEMLKEMYLDEIKKIVKKGELTPVDGEAAHKALEAMEMIDRLCEKEELDSKMSTAGRHRDRMGRYTSRAMVNTLEDMKMDAPDHITRAAIDRCIDNLERNY